MCDILELYLSNIMLCCFKYNSVDHIVFTIKAFIGQQLLPLILQIEEEPILLEILLNRGEITQKYVKLLILAPDVLSATTSALQERRHPARMTASS